MSPNQEIVLIAAVARNGVIGATVDGRPVLPWRLPEDLKHFKALTSGHAIVMGRKTWQSLGRPLPNRHNIVVSRDPAFVAEGATSATSLDAALAAAGSGTVFVIGGGELYSQALPRADRLELTEIDADFPGDTTFPEWNRADFEASTRATARAEAGFDYAFVTYRRRVRLNPKEHTMQISVYLGYAGDAEAALNFYKSVLGGEITELHRYAGSPMADQVGPDYAEKVMHATYTVAGQQIMASDCVPGQHQPFAGFNLALATDNVEQGRAWFEGLAQGGTVLMPFGETFWAKGFGMVKDKFGLSWAVNCG